MSKRPPHLKQLDPQVLLDPGWFKLRMGRRAKIFKSNFPKVLGYQELIGAVWDNTNKTFIHYGSWNGHGVSLDLGIHCDIIDKSPVPSNFQERN